MVTFGPGVPPNTCACPAASITVRVPTFTKDLIMLERGDIGGSIGASLISVAGHECQIGRKTSCQIGLETSNPRKPGRLPAPNLSLQAGSAGRQGRAEAS